MKAVAFFNNKGGVGKTTLSTQIAAFCGSYQKLLGSDMKVLFIDLDEQMNGTQFMSNLFANESYMKRSMNRDLKNKYQYSICDVINDIDFPVEKAVVPTVYDNVDMIPGNLNIKAVAEDVINGPNHTLGQLNLNTQIRKLEDTYEYVFIDCPPAKSGETALGMFLADAVIIPILADPYSLCSLSQCYEMIRDISKTSFSYTQHGLKNLGIVFNQYQPTGVIDKYFIDELLSNTNYPFSGICIRKSVTVSQHSFGHEILIDPQRAKENKPQLTKVQDDMYQLAYYILSSLKR